MSKGEPKAKITIPTRTARAKGGMFDNLRKPEEVESLSIEDLVSPFASQPQDSQLQSSQLQPSQLPEPPEIGHDSQLQPDRPQSSQLPKNQPRRSQPDSSRLDLIAALPEIDGHTEVPHQIIDHLYPHLDTFEQAVFTQLYRLSWGYKKNICRISNERLAERANMSIAKVKQVTRSLEGKGLVEKIDRPHGQNVIQGVEYKVGTSSWQLRRSQPQRSQPDSSQPQYAPNKYKDQKKDQSESLVDCPDCFGTNFWYPEGKDRGVKRCKHERVKGN
ncbi:MAG TPA: replication protein [Pyrinomonadaceae bacterium]